MDGRAGTIGLPKRHRPSLKGVWIYLLHKSTRALLMKSGILNRNETPGSFSEARESKVRVGSGIFNNIPAGDCSAYRLENSQVKVLACSDGSGRCVSEATVRTPLFIHLIM